MLPFSPTSNMPMCQRMANISSGLRRIYQLSIRHDFSPCPKGKSSFISYPLYDCHCLCRLFPTFGFVVHFDFAYIVEQCGNGNALARYLLLKWRCAVFDGRLCHTVVDAACRFKHVDAVLAQTTILVEMEVGRAWCRVEVGVFEIGQHFVNTLTLDVFMTEGYEALLVGFDDVGGHTLLIFCLCGGIFVSHRGGLHLDVVNRLFQSMPFRRSLFVA